MEFNVYCDESCHLQSNDSNYMVLGAVYCSKDKIKKTNEYLNFLKQNCNFSKNFEMKWNKIDKKNLKLYLDVINYFFENDSLKFRAIIIDKTILDHKKYNQTENEFYHKLYYDMLKYIITPGNSYNIYPDIKDTNSYYSHQILLKFLRRNIGDLNGKTIHKVQPIRSYESQIIQITDILIGALTYYYRKLEKNEAKRKIVDEIKKKYGRSLETTSYYNYTKFNILVWSPKDDSNRD